MRSLETAHIAGCGWCFTSEDVESLSCTTGPGGRIVKGEGTVRSFGTPFASALLDRLMAVCDDEKGASMNLWLRLIRVGIGAQRRSPLGADGESVIRLRVWPHDLDMWGHVNGGRYLTMSDLGRLDFSIRSGLFKIVRRQHWTMPIATAGLQFLRPLRLFQTCELHTRVVGWDNKWWYLETKFVRKGRTVATVVAKAVVRGPDGTITPKRLLELLGGDPEPFPVPEHIRRWVEADVIVT
jgi:acyl-CoA thioesterase FadM